MQDLNMEHARSEALLGAFADGELEPEEERSLAAHLRGCVRCRRVLQVQQLVSARLGTEAVAPASKGLRERIVSEIRRMDAPPARWATSGTLRGWGGFPTAPWVGWAVAATVAAAWVTSSAPQWIGEAVDGAPIVVQESSAPGKRIPMVVEALADYRALKQRELPVQVSDAAGLGPVLPFPVTTLSSPEVTLVGAWTTVLRGERAAVLAYRWDNVVILQYVVSEQLFFRQPAVVQALTTSGLYATQEGLQGVVAWADSRAGSIIIGDLPARRLARLRS